MQPMPRAVFILRLACSRDNRWSIAGKLRRHSRASVCCSPVIGPAVSLLTKPPIHEVSTCFFVDTSWKYLSDV